MNKLHHIKFGRLEQFDARSKNFPVRRLIKQEVPKTKMWDFSLKPLDQNGLPACVGFAGAHQAIAAPVQQLWVTNETGKQFYKGAQENDEWPGEDYDGTSGVGLLKYWLGIGFCESGYWAFSLDEERLGIAFNSPALVGSEWKTGMMEPDSDGFIHATGINEGGHETLRLGNDEEGHYFTILNSWYLDDGTPWGQNGRAKLSYDDAEKLRSSCDVLFIQGEKDSGPITPEPPGPTPPGPTPSPCSIAKAYAGLGNFVAGRIFGCKTRLYQKRIR